MDLSTLLRVLQMLIMVFNICMSSDFNRKQCLSDMDVWLIPELQRAWDIYTEKEELYQEEKETLDEAYHEN